MGLLCEQPSSFCPLNFSLLLEVSFLLLGVFLTVLSFSWLIRQTLHTVVRQWVPIVYGREHVIAEIPCLLFSVWLFKGIKTPPISAIYLLGRIGHHRRYVYVIFLPFFSSISSIM
ncbi:uncharacterized protein LOC127149604 [Cucumis melo]|uniref:Uncharacterized protein LOC127149604 n=1 Tax=Cucumis melo TaxID=3656 RepID=A0ABM3KUA5_CUCME|nr:uncharacterized protein LOC127149604 [Cucumis melo]